MRQFPIPTSKLFTEEKSASEIVLYSSYIQRALCALASMLVNNKSHNKKQKSNGK